MSNGKKFNLDEFVSKGDSLYQQQMSGAPVEDPQFPGISRFDDKGQETDAYILRGLENGKVERGSGGSYKYSGMRGSEPVSGSVNVQGNMTPRDAYWQRTHGKHYQSMPKEARQRYGADLMSIQASYGRQPRYSEGKIVSPYSLLGQKQKDMEGMDRAGQIMYGMDFSKKIRGMPTSLTTEDSLMNSMKDHNLDIRGQAPRKSTGAQSAREKYQSSLQSRMDAARSRMKAQRDESPQDRMNRLRNMKFGDD
mgnify:CR=1 FL=1